MADKEVYVTDPNVRAYAKGLDAWDQPIRKAIAGVGTTLENLSIGAGYGIQNQLEGLYQMVAHPVQTGKDLAQMGAAVVKDPGIAVDIVKSEYERATSGPLGLGEVLGENLSPGMFRRNPRELLDITTYHGSPHRINNIEPPIKPLRLEPGLSGEPGYAYHATNLDNLYEIAESGKLRTHAPDFGTDQRAWPDMSIEERAYFSADPKHSYSFAPEDGTPVILRTKRTGEIFQESTGDLFSRKPIDKKALEYLGDDNKWHPLDALEGHPHGKFDMSKIGTGEGNQAYGHGIYLAETPDVAGKYRRGYLPLRQLLAKIRGEIDDPRPEGHLYTVDLPDEHIAKMLDWDAPLSEQPEAVKDALRKVAEALDPNAALPDKLSDAELLTLLAPTNEGKVTGSTLYYHLQSAFGSKSKNPEQASEFLRALGITGIKYFDGGSRAAGDGTRNFVIFDPEVAKILSREGG